MSVKDESQFKTKSIQLTELNKAETLRKQLMTTGSMAAIPRLSEGERCDAEGSGRLAVSEPCVRRLSVC